MMPRSQRGVLVIGSVVAVSLVGLSWFRAGAGAPVAAPAQAASVVASSPGSLQPYLRFTGSGDVTVTPDTAQISLDVTATASTSSGALDQATSRLLRVDAKLRDLGIAAADIQTTTTSTYQEWDSHRYTADLGVAVTVHDLSRAGLIVTDANHAGADAVSGPSFSLQDQHAAYQQALRRAIDDARSKADAAAAQLGVHVTGIVSVDDTGATPQVMPFAAAGAASAAVPVPVPINPGTQDVTAAVSVVFTYAA
jgi:uncharacterized protein